MNPIPSPPSQIWGRTDYFPTCGFHGSLLMALGFPASYVSEYGNDSGVIANLATFSTTTNLVNTPIPHVRIASITDGTSNTIMLGEDAGRPVGYNHARQIYSQFGFPVDGVLNPVSYGGGAWADPYSFAHLCGSTADGLRCLGGICMINCSSNNELYSFHPGGVNVGFVDGSVHFLKESMDPRIIVSLITRAGGEIVTRTSTEPALVRGWVTAGGPCSARTLAADPAGVFCLQGSGGLVVIARRRAISSWRLEWFVTLGFPTLQPRRRWRRWRRYFSIVIPYTGFPAENFWETTVSTVAAGLKCLRGNWLMGDGRGVLTVAGIVATVTSKRSTNPREHRIIAIFPASPLRS